MSLSEYLEFSVTAIILNVKNCLIFIVNVKSPDLTPLDFFLWGFVKNHVYRTPVIDRNDLVHRIENAFQLVTRNMLEHVNENIVKRARACVAAGGNNFEYFL